MPGEKRYQMAKTGRNDPCTCGSGKKYKNCCGCPSTGKARGELSRLKHNRATAYVGETGIRRKNFCRHYMSVKQEIFQEISTRKNGILSSRSETVTCQKGCRHCCALLPGASIQEAELIVYYLYQNENLFDSFIETYPAWAARLEEAERLLIEPQNTGSREGPDRPIQQEITTERLSKQLAFAEEKLYCPFLRAGICSIYEVRPYYCAGFTATTPGEWCDPKHPDFSKRHAYQFFNTAMARDLSFYTGELKKPAWSFMPIMVYEILKNGPEALDKMQVIRLA